MIILTIILLYLLILFLILSMSYLSDELFCLVVNKVRLTLKLASLNN